jgi:pimeloyl-ACP methyl ester carboxylesterase
MRPPVLFIHGVSSNGGHFSGWLNIFANAGFECSAPSLPGHSPFDRAALARLTLSDYLAALKSEAMRLRAPPVIVGHSMGGLLAQQLAASIDCRALVCVASAAPWAMLPSQIRALRFLLPMMTAIIPGRVIEPTQAAIRFLALHGLPEEEQRDLLPTFGAESGRACRAIAFGMARLPGKRFRGPVLCLSGSADRIISRATSVAIARYYGARHEVFWHGHWLIAPSSASRIAGRALSWLEEVLSSD